MANSHDAWYQQKDNTDMTGTDDTVKTSITEQEMCDLVHRLSKPTVASRAKRALFWKIDSPMDMGRLDWNKMAMFDDVQRCMWTDYGSVKRTCKIRPVNSQL